MLWDFFGKRRTHLDFASATPVAPEVARVMEPFWSHSWANPSAIYAEGVKARKVIEDARTELARTLHIRASDVTFTSGGTESNNLALIGTIEMFRKSGKRYEEMEIISTHIEHPSILEALAYLAGKGVVVQYAPIDEDGLIMLPEFKKLISPRTVLVSFAYVNSEIGVVQDVKKLTRAVRAWNTEHNANVLTHLDASQAPLWLPCELDRLGVDLMTLDAGKCYGPKGAGVLARRHHAKLVPILFGGEQEVGLRPGTENPALIIGCVRALVRAQEGWEARSAATAALRDTLFELLLMKIPGTVVNGSRVHRVANNVNISIPGLDSEYAVIWLDASGIAASTRSACGAGESIGSYVVREMAKDEARATSTIRFTLGEETKESDFNRVVQALDKHRKLMRAGMKLQ